MRDIKLRITPIHTTKKKGWFFGTKAYSSYDYGKPATKIVDIGIGRYIFRITREKE